jgi:hypothetical protein
LTLKNVEFRINTMELVSVPTITGFDINMDGFEVVNDTYTIFTVEESEIKKRGAESINSLSH